MKVKFKTNSIVKDGLNSRQPLVRHNASGECRFSRQIKIPANTSKRLVNITALVQKHTPLLVVFFSLFSGPAIAAGEVSELITSSENATPASIITDGVSINWGQGSNQHLEGFVANNRTFTSVRVADRVSVVRRDLPGVATGELCGVFAERSGDNRRQLNPDLPTRASSNVNPTSDENAPGCDMTDLLKSTLVNRGTLDTFSNTGGNPNNIERLDYIFDGGLIAPLNTQALEFAGHAFGEKHGNNRIFIATVLGLDSDSQPSEFGPLVRIGRIGECDTTSICYGNTSIVHDYTFLKSPPTGENKSERVIGVSTEPVAFAYLSLASLGLTAGETYYGVSVFPPDTRVDNQNLLDVTTYPDDTEEADVTPGDSADIYGGTTRYFEANLPGVEGRLVCTGADNSLQPAPGIAVDLFLDSNDDGVLDVDSDALISSLEGSGEDGKFSFSGLTEGTYFVELTSDESANTTNQTFVIAQERLILADIIVDELCATNPGEGPNAVDDQADVISTSTITIPVLENDVSADGITDASTLEIISVSASSNAQLTIVDRTIQYTANASFASTATLDTPALDTFTYQIRDENERTAGANVSVTVQLLDDPTQPTTPTCIDDEGDTACLLVATEVDGVGSVSIFQSSLFFLLLLLRVGKYHLHRCFNKRPTASLRRTLP